MGTSRTHIYLGVENADQSALFYEALLGGPPRTRRTGLAVFEIDALCLVLTLETHPRPTTMKTGGFAIVVPEVEHVGRAAVAMRRAGVRLRLQDQGIETIDPDGNTWRVRFVASAPGRSVIPLQAGIPR